eukprot:8773036-Pyramimonas_sp.AAC.1
MAPGNRLAHLPGPVRNGAHCPPWRSGTDERGPPAPHLLSTGNGSPGPLRYNHTATLENSPGTA